MLFHLGLFSFATIVMTCYMGWAYKAQLQIEENNRKLEQMLLQYANLNDRE